MPRPLMLHPGSFRNHNAALFARFGRDKGADIPSCTEYVRALGPLLNRFGNEPGLSIPARHDVARRIDCGFLAELVAEHRSEDWEAAKLAQDLAYNLAKQAYRL